MTHLHAGANTGFGIMDELAAAASVLAMSVDSESEDTMLLEAAVGSVIADTGSEPGVESTDPENVDVQLSPVDGRVRAELSKVII